MNGPNPYRLMPPSQKLRTRAALAGVDPRDRVAVDAFHKKELATRAKGKSDEVDF